MPEVQGPEGDEWVGLVIVAAGESRRMAGVDKIFTPLVGLPLIAHTVEIFEAHPMVRSLVLVLPPEKVEMGRSLAQERGWRKLGRRGRHNHAEVGVSAARAAAHWAPPTSRLAAVHGSG